MPALTCVNQHLRQPHKTLGPWINMFVYGSRKLARQPDTGLVFDQRMTQRNGCFTVAVRTQIFNGETNSRHYRTGSKSSRTLK